MSYNNEERIGIHSVAKILVEDLGWIFREQPTNDFGLDGFIEVTRYSLDLKTRVPTGRILGVQIKSGKSFFREVKNGLIIFRGSAKHLNYWMNLSVPVILIIYDKVANVAYWQVINQFTVRLTQKSFRIDIPKDNTLTTRCREQLAHHALFKNVSQYKIWQIKSSMDEILLLRKGPLFLYVEIDGIPKSSKFRIQMLVTNECSTEPFAMIHQYHSPDDNRFSYHFHLSRGQSMKNAIADIIPWADAYIDGVEFSDLLLTDHLANDILYFEQDNFYNDILRLRKDKSFLDLACYLSDSSAFVLELRANNISDCFFKINEFLAKKPTIFQRTFL